MEPKTRLRKLADSAHIKIETNIPIRRYFRSGNEMLKMAKVYDDEGNMEAAYVLYLKYVSLFLEKIKQHKDYEMVLPAEKKKTNQTLKLVLSISEEMKNKLRKRYEEEYEEWLVHEEERKRIEEEEMKRLLEEKKKREAEERARAEMIEKDRQLAIWTQAQIDQGLDPGNSSQSREIANSPDQKDVSSPGDHRDQSCLPPPSYQDLDLSSLGFGSGAVGGPNSSGTVSGPDSTNISDLSTSLTLPGPSDLPSFDRSSKPKTLDRDSYHDNLHTSKQDMPAIPDRSMKPVLGGSSGLRTVIVPSKLITRFLQLAKPNSDKNVETLGMLGGKLSKNKFTVTHLLIPKQTGQSDRCDLQGHEELGDTYDKEDIILVGWIHTHPAYDVFLSSVDMHNQYEYQNMLHEFIAIVCSIKFNETGYLTLTSEGMSEIGQCAQDNFHPHSKTPALFENADHVIADSELDIKVMDLR